MVILLPLLHVAILPGSSLSQKVTFDEPIMSVQNTVKALAERTQAPLVTSKDEPEWRIFVKVKDVPLKELMAKIGEVTLSDWKQVGGKFTLTPSPKKLAQAQAESLARKVEKFKALVAASTVGFSEVAHSLDDYINEMRAINASKASGNRDDGSREYRMNPASVFLAKFIAQTDPLPFATGRFFGRLVFSTQPTPRQFQLDLSKLVSSKQELMRQLGDWLYAQSLPSGPQTAKDYGFSMRPAKFAERIRRSIPTTIAVVAEKTPWGQWFLSLNLYDAAGVEIFYGSQGLEVSNRFVFPAKRDWFDVDEFKLSEPELEFWSKVEKSASFQPKPLRLSSAADMERLMRPDLHEPLSYGATEFARALAESRSRNSVMALSDGLATVLSYQVRSGITLNQILAENAYQLNWIESTDDQWYTVKIDDPDLVASTRRARVESTKALHKMAATLESELYDEYISNLSEADDYDVAARHAGRLELASFAAKIPYVGKAADRFFYGLTQAQRAKLISGKSLRAGSLSALQKARLEQLAYSAGSAYRNNRAGYKYQVDHGASKEALAEFMKNFATTSVWDPYSNAAEDMSSYRLSGPLQSEPTYSLPNGVPAAAHIHLTQVSVIRWEVLKSPDARKGMEIRDQELAVEVEKQEHLDNYSPPESGKRYFRQIEHCDYIIHVDLGPCEGIFGRVLRTRPVTQTGVPADKLPKELLISTRS